LAALLLASSSLSMPALGQTGKTGQPPTAVEDVLPEGLTVQKNQPASGPDIFLLPDKDGKLRRVLGYRYEDFLDAWQAQGAAANENQQPRFTITNLTVDAEERQEAIAATIAIEVELHSEGWLEAPLRLPSLAVENCELDGEAATAFVSFDPKQDGYVAWLRGRPNQRRTVRISGQFSTERNGDGRRLAIQLPTARSSVVDLKTTDRITVSSPSTAVVTHTQQDGRFESRIEGVKNSLVLAWGAADDATDGGATVEASIDSIVSIDPSRVSYDSSIKLTTLGEPLDRVRIRLPLGAAAPVAPDGTGYQIELLGGDGSATPAEVEIVFDEPTRTPPVVRLTATQPAAGPVFRIGAFEVVGAFRHTGHVAVRTSDQLHAHFQRDGQVQQIEPASLPPALVEQPLLAAFETSGAAWAIEAHTQPRQRKITVTPDYQLHLGSQGAALEASLNYQITGGPAFELRVDLRGWELTEEPIESGGVVDLAEQHVTPEQVLMLPLRDADAQEVRLKFRLRREAGLGVHDLPLPEVQDAYALPGELRLTCDDAWRATALIERSVGVSPVDLRLETQPVNAASDADSRQPIPVRFQTFLPQSRLAVDVSERSRVINVQSVVNARIEAATLTAEQTLQYDILYQPAEQVAALVSADLLSNEGLELLLDGKSLPSSAVDIRAIESDSSNSDDNLRLVVTFPGARLGKARLSLRTQQVLSESQQAGKAVVQIPLAVPDQPTKTMATVLANRSDLRVALAGGSAVPWTPSPGVRIAGSDQAASPAALTVESNRPTRELMLRLEPANAGPPVETRIDAAWVQTWIAGGMRQDRVVYQFHSSGDSVTALLPDGFDLVEVLLDGAVASADRTRTGAITVTLSDQNDGASHTLELRRHTPLQLGSWGKQSVAFPRLEGASAWSPFFWQLILPPDLAALATPAGMSAEYRLGWHGIRWGREPTQSQRDLERWTTATAAPTPGPRTNQYLYSAFVPPTGVEFVAVRRIWLVVAGGLVVLAVGLAWLYTPLARTAAFWLTLCVAAACLLFVFPEAVILLVQAVILGGAFTVLAAVTQWLIARPSPRRTAPPAPASSVASLAATQPWTTEPPTAAAASSSGTTYQPTGSAT
jgi:hypothetical protein